MQCPALQSPAVAIRVCSSPRAPGRHLARPSAAQAVSVEDPQFLWTGQDEFSSLQDRVDAPPLPLPPIRRPQRVILVRHGQSTWNAEGRIQGCSNFSELTPKGMGQAEMTREMVGCCWQWRPHARRPARRTPQPARACRGGGRAPTHPLAHPSLPTSVHAGYSWPTRNLMSSTSAP